MKVDFTLDDVRAVVREEVAPLDARLSTLAGRVETYHEQVIDRIDEVKTMLEEDFLAEAKRVDRLESNLNRTRKELKDHIADKSVHKA